MDLYEYQARDLFASHNVPVLRGILARDLDQARAGATQLGAFPVVVKAQVKVGGRGKAGGVKLASTPEEAVAWTHNMLNKEIRGHKVRQVMITEGVDIKEEYYFSIFLDRPNHRHLALCSKQGGIDIESLSKEDPEAVVRFPLDPEVGITEEVAKKILEKAGFSGQDISSLSPVLQSLWGVYLHEDATLVEVNPLAKLSDGRVVALDGKVSLDDNARFRHLHHENYQDKETEDPYELAAADSGLNYVRLGGEVGIIGNGAGLVMATLDAVAMAGKNCGVTPANFLDIGGGASAEVMAKSLQLVLSDPQVQSIFINVFGGITSCALVADGITQALSQLPKEGGVPIVVRLDGNNASAGRQALEDFDHENVRVAQTMDEAAELVTKLAASRIAAAK